MKLETKNKSLFLPIHEEIIQRMLSEYGNETLHLIGSRMIEISENDAFKACANEYVPEWNRPVNPALIPSMDKIKWKPTSKEAYEGYPVENFLGDDCIFLPARRKGRTFARLMLEYMRLMDDENVRILPTSKMSGYYGVDIYVPSPKEERVGQPFIRLQGTMSIKDETYLGALWKGIEFYKEYKLNRHEG